MDNPIADIIREYTSYYNTYVTKRDILSKSYSDFSTLYFGVFKDIVDDEESDRMINIFAIFEQLLDEYDSNLEDISNVFEDLTKLNEDYNQSIIETLDVTDYGQKYVDMTVLLKDTLDRTDVMLESCQNYIDVISGSIDTFKEKYNEQYQEYMSTITENVDVADSVSNIDTSNAEDIINIETAAEIFDTLNNKPMAMFNENLLDAAYSKSKMLPTVLTRSEYDEFSKIIYECNNNETEIRDKYTLLTTKYGKVDLLNQNLASVNNIIHECAELQKIFLDAVENPYSWAIVNTAQSAKYRYSALQNDYKIIIDSLNDIELRILNGSARRVGEDRYGNVEIKNDDVNFDHLNTLTNTLTNDVNAFLDKCTDENISNWVIYRYNNLISCVNEYSNIIDNISYEHLENGYTNGAYGMESFGSVDLNNLMRECNLIASEIKKVIK